mmetsp:Transcript_23821/g.42175  ORF Transcript_23821/g.42175 Transcript_23821/m.42175 type:complete len:1150 (-) Transcript_23821:39-3488(-)
MGLPFIIKLLQVVVHTTHACVGVILGVEEGEADPGLILGFEVRLLEVSEATPSQVVIEWLNDQDCSIVYDLSHQVLLTYLVLSQLPLSCKAFFIGWDEQVASEFGQPFPYSGQKDGVSATLAVIKSLSIQDAVVVSNNFDTGEALSSSLNVVASLVQSNDDFMDSLELNLLRNLKSTGVRSTVLDVRGDMLAYTFELLEKINMMQEGYAFFATPQGSWANPAFAVTGALMIVPEGTLGARSHLSALLLRLEWALKTENVTEVNLAHKASVLGAILASPRFILVNLIDSEPVEVGVIDSGIVKLSRPITYPGRLSAFESTSSVSIKISTLNSNFAITGEANSDNPDAFNGAFLAFNEMEESGILGRFKFQTELLDCGALGYDPIYQRNCISKAKESLGVAILSSYSSSHMLGVLEGLKLLSLTHPVVGAYNSATFLSDKGAYPNFVRVMKSTMFSVAAFYQLLKLNQYTKVNILYSDDAYGKSYYSNLKSTFDVLNITIANAEDARAVPIDVYSNPDKYAYIGEAFMNSGVRPTIIILGYIPMRLNLIELLYKAGARQSNILLMLNYPEASLWTIGTAEEIDKRMEVVLNSLFVDISVFQGQKGIAVKEGLKLWVAKPYSIHCQYYDAAYLLGYAIQTMILRGKDYSDHSQLIQQLRDTSFVGCSGSVSIDTDSNDRRNMDIDIFNLIEEGQEYVYEVALRIALYRIKAVSVIKEVVWPEGKSTPPPMNTRNYENCPFPIEEDYVFIDGQRLNLYIGLGFFAYAVVISVLLLGLKNFSHSVEMMPRKQVEVTFQDRLVLALVLIDFLQTLAHAPSTGDEIYPLAYLADYINLGIFENIPYSEGVIFSLLRAALVIVAIWLALSFSVAWRKLQAKNLSPNSLTDLAEVSIPLFGYLLFTPLNSILLSVFSCTRAHAPQSDSLSFDDSYLDKDCYVDCWSGTHLKYGIASVCALALYFPVTILTLPHWQTTYPDLNVKTRPSFYLQRSLFSLSIAAARMSLKDQGVALHGSVFILIISAHMGLSLARKPFNYPRLNLWSGVLNIELCALCVASIVRERVPSEGVAYFFYFSVCPLILLCGLILQIKKYPKLLSEKKTADLPTLFKFAFDLRNVKPPPSLSRTSISYYQTIPQPKQEENSLNSEIGPSRIMTT